MHDIRMWWLKVVRPISLGCSNILCYLSKKMLSCVSACVVHKVCSLAATNWKPWLRGESVYGLQDEVWPFVLLVWGNGRCMSFLRRFTVCCFSVQQNSLKYCGTNLVGFRVFRFGENRFRGALLAMIVFWAFVWYYLVNNVFSMLPLRVLPLCIAICPRMWFDWWGLIGRGWRLGVGC